jgi:hypothetical protein
MQDPSLKKLVRALDTALEIQDESDQSTALHGDLEVAALRLRCLSARLGQVADESPYLAFLRRTVERKRPMPLAASA